MVQRDVAIDANTTARELTYTSGTAQICAGPTSSPRNLQDFSHINNAYTRDNPVIISGCGSSSTRSQILSETILWTKRVCFDHTSILSSTLGSLRIRSQKISWQLVAPDSEAVFPEQNESEDRVSCIFMPAPWLQTLGLKRALHMSVDQPSAGPWKPTMTIYNTVPENAPIFDLCARGDVDGVRDLLLGGSASIHDMDPDGFTPIHVRQRKFRESRMLTSHFSMPWTTRSPKCIAFLSMQVHSKLCLSQKCGDTSKSVLSCFSMTLTCS